MTTSDRPVSIVVLTYNQLPFTRQCFEHLYTNTDNFQLVVVDNASSDDTPAFLEQFEREHDNVRLVLNRDNLGFAGGCNRGVELAKHGWICLLNNDTIPLPGWLDAMRDAFDKDAGVGIVGSKLMFPSTLIQHAGIEFEPRREPTVHFMPYHRFVNAPHDLEEAEVLCEVPGITGACMLTSKTVWSRANGLDEGYVLGNYEDVDFNLKARKSGLKVIYQPKSRLIHYGHASFGTSEMSDQSRANYHRLMSRWTKDLVDGLWRVRAPDEPTVRALPRLS